jgi:hypothetical protein
MKRWKEAQMPFGWVKDVGESNEAYLAKMPEDDPWYQLILDTHDKLLHLDPDYEISQIKEKFGTLTYYYHSRLAEEIPEIRDQMGQVVNEASRLSEQL